MPLPSRTWKTFAFVLLFLFLCCSYTTFATKSPQNQQPLLRDKDESSIRNELLVTTNIPKGGSSAATLPKMVLEKPMKKETNDESQQKNDKNNNNIQFVFSDLDGTLVHYPGKNNNILSKSPKGNALLKLPPSATGMRGIVSSKTLALVQEIRHRNVKFVLVSGMRTPTLLHRLPFLPKADAYCTEAGGRIFYPTTDVEHSEFVVKPQKYDGASPDDLEPYGLVEDLEWKARMEKISGPYGDENVSLNDLANHPLSAEKILAKLEERDGLLWDFARYLIGKGFVVDNAGYSACFRVNRKQQNAGSITDQDFDDLLHQISIKPFEGLASSINLSCIDYYPAISGKKNCCQYLAEKFSSKKNDNNSDKNDDNNDDKSLLLSNLAVCLCDDDNDLEMAKACKHAYIPGISSDSMAKVIRDYPEHFTLTGGGIGDDDDDDNHGGPAASETALSLILELLVAMEQQDTKTAASAGEA